MIAGRVALTAFAVGTLTAMAMPTRQELMQAKPIVEELMAEDQVALKAKKKTPVEMGEQALEYAERTEKEPVKFLLIEGAFNYFMSGEAYDKAADAINALMTDVKDVPPDVVVELISRAARRANAQKAPRLFMQFRSALAKAKAAKAINGLRKAVAAKPSDSLPRRQLAESLAILGDWKGALAEFAKLADTPEGKVAANEISGKELPAAADFWWEFKAQTFSDDGDAFRVHAAMLYQRLVDDNGLDGLKVTLAEKRIKSMDDLLAGKTTESEEIANAGKTEADDGRKPLSVFGTRPITIPLGDGVEPIEFVYVKPGEFEKSLVWPPNGKTVKSRLTYPFWIARKPLTGKQYLAWAQNPVLDGMLERVWRKRCGDRWKDALAHIEHLHFLNHRRKIEEMGRYASALPKGYVMRPISDAEFNRALFLGCGKNIFKGKWDDKMVPSVEEIAAAHSSSPRYEKEAIPLKKPDRLGVWGMIGYGRTLVEDRYLPDLVGLTNVPWGNGVTYGEGKLLAEYKIPYPAKDPFFYVADGAEKWLSVPACDMCDMQNRVVRQDVSGKSYGALVRLVIGPDLVGQWMKKNGKKK
ncbi:MAG: hypothetical protein MJ240_03245 [Kiritimatiellae bacterium]|nr:hypothetical protein [Kiritimatiellia bacterium]